MKTRIFKILLLYGLYIPQGLALNVLADPEFKPCLTEAKEQRLSPECHALWRTVEERMTQEVEAQVAAFNCDSFRSKDARQKCAEGAAGYRACRYGSAIQCDRIRTSTLETARQTDRRAAHEKKRRQTADFQAKKPGAKIGMTKTQVINQTNWGNPERVNKTITAHGVREQWVYGTSAYLYFENGALTAIQTNQ